jgi:serine/threonine protein kinase
MHVCRAPEIVQHQKYSLAVDCWSLGVILFILLT